MSKIVKECNDNILPYILYIRNRRVILDTDIARIYGIQTKRLNEQVKRNVARFPGDFMFRLTDEELKEVVANCDHLEKLKFSSSNPYAFIEHGALMLSGIINTQTAIETSIFIVRAFVKLRNLLSTHAKLEKKIIKLESKYEKRFTIVFEALKQLIKQESKPRKMIGFKTNDLKQGKKPATQNDTSQ